VLTKVSILDYLTTIKLELEKDGVEKIGLFGSFAKGSADLLSDVDIVIKTSDDFVKKHKGIQGFLYLETLRERLKHNFHRDVDMCDESGLKDDTIIKEAIYA
jgi:predicted nucleotidyltransferase